MKDLLVKIALLLFPLFLFSQEHDLFFSDAIKINFKKYSSESNLAYKNKDFKRGKFLFDSLVKGQLVGTKFDNYSFKKIQGGKLNLESSKKPIFLLTYASWCVPSKGEIPALNKLAQKYSNDVKFVVLFWDKKHNVKKVAKKFNSHITVCFAHETYKNDAPAISSIKHTLGFPTCFYLDEHLKIVDIKRGGGNSSPSVAYMKAYTQNYNAFRDGLSTILINKNISKERLATN
ncbi:redoxin family protein [Flavobacterium sp. WW92]|uniref:TlpA family protein disulfide reductase n=1 Tax=unclassified Flavobacterium TaxID=196869 RepID=UPI002224C7A3|nr:MULTISPECIES: redoxin domain-containing protein [unclassified Flavobacterium]WDO14623.1 redoxin family protein [Flavobacterium sp. WW92]